MPGTDRLTMHAQEEAGAEAGVRRVVQRSHLDGLNGAFMKGA